MGATVIYLGDGDVGEAVVYGLPFIVGEPTELPDGFEFAGKILANPTFAVMSDFSVTVVAAPDDAVEAAPAVKRRGRQRRAGAANPGLRRYTVEDLANVTITLPTFIEDRWWLWQWPWEWGPMPIADQEPYTGVRPPLDRNVVRVADLASTQRRLFVYDSAIARWVSLLDLDLTDEAPLSTRYGAGLQAILGVKLSSEYGVDVPAATGLEAGRCQSALAMRLDGPATIVPGTYF